MSSYDVVFQLRHAKEAQWEAVKDTFIPKMAEPCVTEDGDNAGKIKIGDGVSTWGELKYSGEVGREYLKSGGSLDFASLPTPSVDNVGTLYNINDEFTADSKFLPGEVGNKYPANSNAYCLKSETSGDGKFNNFGLPKYSYWSSITYGNGKFVAIAGSGYGKFVAIAGSRYGRNDVAYSEDGMTWAGSTLPVSGDWCSVVYGNGKFIAIGGRNNATNIAAYSVDGITWTQMTLPLSKKWKKIIYGDNKFLIVADDTAQYLYSEDGLEWSESSEEGNKINNAKFATYGGGKYVIVEYNTTNYAYSTDGVNWTLGTLPNRAVWQDITYTGDKFILSGKRTISGLSSFYIIYSTDGITWNESTIPNDVKPATNSEILFASNESGIVGCISNSDKFIYSTDGITWTTVKSPIYIDWSAICYGNNIFVAVVEVSSVVSYSNNGSDWNVNGTLLPNYSTWISSAYGNGVFVAISLNSDKAAYSTDGTNWTESTMPVKANWYSVTYGNGKFVAVAQNSTVAAYSTDGITWTQSTLPASAYWYSVAYGNGKFVAVADGTSNYAYSEDGEIWSIHNFSSSNGYVTIEYVNDKFICMAFFNDSFVYSTDGLNWPYVTEYQYTLTGNVLWVHVIPSSEYAAILLSFAIATNLPLPYVTEYQDALTGNVLWVHVIPSSEYADAFEEYAIATNLPLPYVTDCHFSIIGNVVETQSGPNI